MKLFNAFDRKILSSPDFDKDLLNMIEAWNNPPTALQVFRVVDDIKLMRAYETIVPYRLIERLDEILEQTMIRENITYKELNNRALWRDQDF